MTPVFADTSFYVAILNSVDRLHAVAVNWLKEQSTTVVTTEFVLLELANFVARGSRRQVFGTILDLLRTEPNTTILELSHEKLEAGIQLYRQREDKAWSLTDCISFNTMHELGIRSALTADHHFEQAGFEMVLK